MLLPSLARLPVTPTGAGQEDLPAELVALVQVLVHSDDPCRELVNQCMINKRWAVPCRDGTIYEATNRRMGWYGTHGSLVAVQQHYLVHPDPSGWTPPATPQAYAQQAHADMLHVHANGMQGMPGTTMWWVFNPNVQNVQTGTPRPWFTAMAIVAIQRNNHPYTAGEVLRQVPHHYPDYDQIALEAVRAHAGAIYQVYANIPNYDTIAQIACEANPRALEHVLSVRPDVYYEVARAAVARNGEVLRIVEGSLGASAMSREPTGANGPLPQLRALSPAEYIELAIVAVAQNPDLLQWVHPSMPGYERVAIRARRARNVAQRQLAGP